MASLPLSLSGFCPKPWWWSLDGQGPGPVVLSTPVSPGTSVSLERSWVNRTLGTGLGAGLGWAIFKGLWRHGMVSLGERVAPFPRARWRWGWVPLPMPAASARAPVRLVVLALSRSTGLWNEKPPSRKMEKAPSVF